MLVAVRGNWLRRLGIFLSVFAFVVAGLWAFANTTWPEPEIRCYAAVSVSSYAAGDAARCREWTRDTIMRGPFPLISRHRDVDFYNAAGLTMEEYDALFAEFARSYGMFGGFTWGEAKTWGWVVFVGFAAFCGVWLVIMAASRTIFA